MLLLLKLQKIREQVLIKNSYSEKYSSRWFFFSVWRRDSLVPESCGLEECYISMCGWQGLGWRTWVFLSCMPDELPCWGYNSRVALGCIGLEAAGEQGLSSPNPPGNTKRSGACWAMSPPTALWRLCGSVMTRECDLWVQESWPSFPWVSETKLLFLQAARQINIFPINWPPSILQC